MKNKKILIIVILILVCIIVVIGIVLIKNTSKKEGFKSKYPNLRWTVKEELPYWSQVESRNERRVSRMGQDEHK